MQIDTSRSFNGHQERRHCMSCSAGFTLVEILIASTIGAIATIAGLMLWQSNLKATSTLLQQQSLRDDWSRVNLLINSDISESCGASSSGGSLTLQIKSAAEELCSSTSNAVITYKVDSDSTKTLRRSGPPINLDGSLDLQGKPVSQSIIEGASFDPSCTTDLQACYKLTLTDGSASYSGVVDANLSGRSRVREFP